MRQLSNAYCIASTYFSTLSVLQGDFPSKVILSKVLPMYKADNQQFIQNYVYGHVPK